MPAAAGPSTPFSLPPSTLTCVTPRQPSTLASITPRPPPPASESILPSCSSLLAPSRAPPLIPIPPGSNPHIWPLPREAPTDGGGSLDLQVLSPIDGSGSLDDLQDLSPIDGSGSLDDLQVLSPIVDDLQILSRMAWDRYQHDPHREEGDGSHGGRHAMDFHPKEKELFLTIISANDLVSDGSADWTSGFRAVVTVNGDRSSAQSTIVDRTGGTDPTWNRRFRLPIPSSLDRPFVEVQLHSGNGGAVGSVRLDVYQLHMYADPAFPMTHLRAPVTSGGEIKGTLNFSYSFGVGVEPLFTYYPRQPLRQVHPYRYQPLVMRDCQVTINYCAVAPAELEVRATRNGDNSIAYQKWSAWST